jgi:subtilisin family serine protease
MYLKRKLHLSVIMQFLFFFSSFFSSVVLAKKFIIEVSSVKEFTIESSMIRMKSGANQIVLNKVNSEDSVKIGDFEAIIVEYPELPLFFYSMSSVKFIEEDLPVKASRVDYYLENFENLQKSYVLQQNPVWGLDRIDQKPGVLNAKYYSTSTGGSDADVYIVDTGIDIAHPEFEGRAVWGGNFVDTVNTDCNSHGTHVAGTVGSKTYGVSKKTKLIAVKVLDCSGGGSFSGVLKGLEFVAQNAKTSKRPSVINMSLGGPKSSATDRAIANLEAAGVSVVVAAGNENSDACNVSPASNVLAVSVGATTRQNTKAGFSNWGKCVSILAPGAQILSTVPGGKIKELQGTSMASPHVAGVYALILGENPRFTPATMRKIIVSISTKGAITGFSADTPNNMLYSIV